MISQMEMAASVHRDREHFPTTYPWPLEDPSSMGILQSSVINENLSPLP